MYTKIMIITKQHFFSNFDFFEYIAIAPSWSYMTIIISIITIVYADI